MKPWNIRSKSVAVLASISIAGLLNGCAGHDKADLAGVTTVHFGGINESMAAVRAMNLFDLLSKPEIFTAPTGSTGGIMIFAQLVGGGSGALWMPPGGGASWTLPNGKYNFSALGSDGGTSTINFGGSVPYCGLALGDDGNRGTSITLNGSSKTVDILMGSTGSGSNGATQGTTGSPSCGMTPFMAPLGSGVTCPSGSGTCFPSSVSYIGFCNGSIPDSTGGDTSGSSAGSCSGLTGSPAASSAVSSVSIQFVSYNAFTGSGGLSSLSVPYQTTSESNYLSYCLTSCPSGLCTSSIPLIPTGGGNQQVGGPAAVTANGAANFNIPTFISVYSGSSCSSGYQRTYAFPYGISVSPGANSGVSSNMLPTYINTAGGAVSQAGTGYWTNGGSASTSNVRLWIQYP